MQHKSLCIKYCSLGYFSLDANPFSYTELTQDLQNDMQLQLCDF